MEQYKQITKVLVWIVVLSTAAYFILLPVSFTRPNPTRISPQKANTANIQANPLQIIGTTTPVNVENVNVYTTEIPTNSTPTLELPKPLLQIPE